MTTETRFGLRLRHLRLERGYSQEKLAELAGLSTDSISNLERGQNVPGLDTVEALRAAFALPIGDFLDYLGHSPAPDPARQRLEDSLLRASRSLDLPVLEVAVAQVEALGRLRRGG